MPWLNFLWLTSSVFCCFWSQISTLHHPPCRPYHSCSLVSIHTFHSFRYLLDIHCFLHLHSIISEVFSSTVFLLLQTYKLFFIILSSLSPDHFITCWFTLWNKIHVSASLPNIVICHFVKQFLKDLIFTHLPLPIMHYMTMPHNHKNGWQNYPLRHTHVCLHRHSPLPL